MIQITAIELKIKDHLVGLFNVIEHIVLERLFIDWLIFRWCIRAKMEGSLRKMLG
ncbi:hypothetical protein [Sunxiuqinia elliptica]|uniref:hypothetical protein n=1 Tax=Sunxiuqinia elliptica TaxID=655355 RepID=UPI0010DADE46|nr:hypothetical protein [Sunxiuqinia elliptica]TDO57088.1 hypothetical protein DET65_3670 [Sunxiuqinia elliptica]